MSNMTQQGSEIAEIAEQLKNASENKKVQLIYAFNSTGKTRLSRKFKELVDNKDLEKDELSNHKIFYYNSFTEDLFYWDNGEESVLRIHDNLLTKWLLKEQGLDTRIAKNFQNFTDSSAKLTFDENEISFKTNVDGNMSNIKISKGEESSFIWSIFYTLIDVVVDILNSPESEDDSKISKNLEYIFIDDPVSSLDENHLIKSAVYLAIVINKSSTSLKFIITTHNTLFYNVLYNELKKDKQGYLLNSLEDGKFQLEQKNQDSNTSFFYHLHLKNLIEDAVEHNKIEKYHFMLLRNLYEKTAQFLGYPNWGDLLPKEDDAGKRYARRVMNFYSHSKLSDMSVVDPTPEEKQMVGFLIKHLNDTYKYFNKNKPND